MKQSLTFLAILLFAFAAHAKGVNNDGPDIQASTYSDGMQFDVSRSDVDLQLTVAGPDGSRYSERFAYAESAFFSIDNRKDGALPDGLYKYEARAIPAITISREESSKMADRNVLRERADTKNSYVSGNFRVVNGLVVDPDLEEFSTIVLPSTGTVE